MVTAKKSVGIRKKRTVMTRSIICSHLERVGSRVLEEYREEITDQIKSHHGIYALYHKDNLYYVGLATNLKTRVNQHLRDRHQGKWDRFSLYIIRKEDHIRELECLLLRIAAPKGNSQKGRLRHSTDMLPFLKKRVKIRILEDLQQMFGRSKRKVLPKAKPSKETDNGDCPLKGLLKGRHYIYSTYKGTKVKALVRKSGKIRYNKVLYHSPSGAAKAIGGKAIDGWYFWKYRDEEGRLRNIHELRK